MSAGDMILFASIALIVFFVYRLRRARRGSSDFQTLNVIQTTEDAVTSEGDSAVGNDDKISIVGLPNSGKTIYFCVCMDLMQKWFNRLDNSYSIIYETPCTDQIVRGVISNMRDNQSWAANTQENINHRVSILYKNKRKELCFLDYSGEEFKKAYDNPRYIGDRQKSGGHGGIIFIISSASLFDKVNDELSRCLFNLFKELEETKFYGKLAIVFTQGDRIKDIGNPHIEDLFKQQQPNCHARMKVLRCEYKFFLVTAVDCIVANNGQLIPPVNYSPQKHSHNVCEPLCWLMGIDDIPK